MMNWTICRNQRSNGPTPSTLQLNCSLSHAVTVMSSILQMHTSYWTDDLMCVGTVRAALIMDISCSGFNIIVT